MREHISAQKKSFLEWKSEKMKGNKSQDPFKTLIIYKLDYKAEEGDVAKQFSKFGEVKYCRVVRDLEGKSRGYAFVEYQTVEQLMQAYRKGSGVKILGREVEVDCEYARTKKDFRPRRFGGGLGSSRKSLNHPYPM